MTALMISCCNFCWGLGGSPICLLVIAFLLFCFLCSFRCLRASQNYLVCNNYPHLSHKGPFGYSVILFCCYLSATCFQYSSYRCTCQLKYVARSYLIMMNYRSICCYYNSYSCYANHNMKYINYFAVFR